MKRLMPWLAAAGLAFCPAVKGDGMLFDFGADATQTIGGVAGPAVTWNNVDATVGGSEFGLVEGLALTDGTPTAISFVMVSRFNGANESGTTTSPLYPSTATRDSLFGNTELFSNLENITPIFKLSGLDGNATYSLRFYASRMGVSDNRETRYTVTGAEESFADLDASNNVTNRAAVTGVRPDGAGEITIALSAGPNNNNANHFTYLGVLEVEISTGGKLMIDFGGGGSRTEVVEQPASAAWNNVTATIGSSPTGSLDNLVTTNGTATSAGFRMTSRFNGANSNGSAASTNFPVTATQDSLFGNTEAFSGLSNILPAFKLTGLDAGYLYTFTFYGSRAGVSDNRETRYTVTGANTGSADLNTANNVNGTVTVEGIRPDSAGEIAVALTPGPNNNNGNHFTYLGVMKVDFAPVRTPRILVDFGAAGTPTEMGPDDPDNAWNNVTTAVGQTDDGSLTNLVRTDGSATSINIQMVSRFNGANENGIQSPGLYPTDAKRDSLFGNTELFSGLENVTPIFKLTGLNPATAYSLQFFASRMGVGDNRETRYTVTGSSEQFVDLNIANNETEIATVTNALPNAQGEITIALSPGPNNDNGNHFVYLGVLQMDWAAAEPSAPPRFTAATVANGTFRATLSGTAGKTYKIQRTTDFSSWTDAQTVTQTGASAEVTANVAGGLAFFRAVEQ